MCVVLKTTAHRSRLEEVCKNVQQQISPAYQVQWAVLGQRAGLLPLRICKRIRMQIFHWAKKMFMI
jgi:hypothetical protein